MTDYTKTTDFTSKDSLPSGDSGKIIRGAEFGTEFDNIETAVNSKSNIENPSFTGNITVTGTVDGRDIAADGTKLDTVETSADVTDTANVTAAGAVMDSELTNITAVKALNQGVATTDSPTFAAVTSTGNVTVGGTVDGRDVAADGTKLDGIEAGATADQTPAQIKTAYESNANTNAFTDADHTKLDGIEASADVTDATNVTAAGALMDSEVTNLAQVKAFDSADYATAAQGTTADNALPKTGGAMTGAITTNSTFDGRDVATDGTKLDGIEALADVTDTANVTAAGALMDSELTSIASVKALNQGVATTDSPTFDGLTVDSQDVVLATFQRDGGGSSSSFGGYNIKFTAANSTLGDDYFLGIDLGGQFSLTTDSNFFSPVFTATSTGIDVNGTVEFNGLSGTGAVTVTDILDQDNMSSNSATALATQQSIKSYVDSQVATSDTLAEVLANGNATGGTDVAFGDNDKAIFGAGSDLQIYHDGSNSRIREVGTGSLLVDAESVYLRNTAGDSYFQGLNGGAANVFHNGVVKLATTSTGVDVLGTVTADGLTVDGSSAGRVTSAEFKNNANSGGTEVAITLANQGGTSNADVNLVANRVGSNFGSDFYIETSDGVDGTNRKRLNVGENGDISFYEDTGTTAKLFWDASAEALGIGTSSPEEALHVSGSFGDAITSKFENTGSALSYIEFENSAASGALIGARGQRLSFLPNGTETMVIDASGNVGIGTSSPSAQLHLAKAGGTLIKLGTSVNTSEIEAREVGGGNSLILSSVNSADHLVIDGAGNVGIGTSSPARQLTVENAGGNAIASIKSGTSSASFLLMGDTASDNIGMLKYNNADNSLGFFAGSNSTERMRIDSSGNVGIGDSDPSQSLNIARASADATFRMDRTGTGASALLFTCANGETSISSTKGGQDLLLKTANIEAMRIDSSGTAMFKGGTTNNAIQIWESNSEIARIGGSSGTLNFLVGSTTESRMAIDSSGNVGIGTDSPSTKLMLEHTNDGAVGGTIRIKDRDSQQGANQLTGAIEFESEDATTPTSGVSTAIKAFAASSTGGSYLTISTTDISTSTLDEAMRIDSSQNLLVGTTLNDGQSIGTGSQDGIVLAGESQYIQRSDNANLWLSKPSGATSDEYIKFYADSALVGSIGTNGGDLTIGTGTVGLKFNDSANLISAWDMTANAPEDGLFDLGYSNGRFKDLYLSGTANVEKVTAERTNGVCAEFRRSNNGHAVQFFHNSVLVGSVSVTGTATTYNTSSDQRLKDNIVDAPSASDDIDAIQVRSFDWKADGSHQKYGMIAQELNTVAPEAVSEGETEEDMLGVDYSKLVPMLVKEIQSLRARVAQLETN